jgi:hypothetical protein
MKFYICFCSTMCFLMFTGCATVFKGYEDSVILYNAPTKIRVFTKDSIEIPVHTTYIKGLKPKQQVVAPGIISKYDTSVVVGEVKNINLRSNTDHLLILRYEGQEKRIYVYPKISTSWFIFDLLTLGFGVDAYTGNWNCFEDIDASF